MIQWWNGLTALNQVFYSAALFFSMVFLWQFIASVIGLGGHGEADFSAGHDADFSAGHGADVNVGHGGLDVTHGSAHPAAEAAETVSAFRLLSLRAVMAFFMLFSWAAALYVNNGLGVTRAISYALLWGLTGWVLVVLLINSLRRLSETGTARLGSCVGLNGTVYLDIPAGGHGEVRVAVSGVVTLVKARAAGGVALKAGTPVLVTQQTDETTVEVWPLADTDQGKETQK